MVRVVFILSQTNKSFKTIGLMQILVLSFPGDFAHCENADGNFQFAPALIEFGRNIVNETPDAVWEVRLCDVGIFRDLAHDEIRELEKHCHFREAVANTVFYESQQAGETVFFIKSGRVRLYHLSAEGKTFTTAILEAGAFFGEVTLQPGSPCDESYAETVTDCTIGLISRAAVEGFLLADCRIARRVIEVLEKRLIEAECRLSDLVLKNIPSRLVSLLLRFARKNDLAVVHLTHEELSQLLGTRRETVTRILNGLHNQNLIELRRGCVTLLDTERLKKISAE